jgi:dienelactone hydrolase
MRRFHFSFAAGLFLVCLYACSKDNNDSLAFGGGKGGAAGATSRQSAATGGSASAPQGGTGGYLLYPQGGSQDASASSVDASASSVDASASSVDVAASGGRAGDGGTVGTVDLAAAGGSATGPFPRADGDPTVQTVSGTGPYESGSYSSGFTIAKGAFSSGTIFYPTTAAPPFAAIAFSPGFTEVEAGFPTWGKVLASHGIVALVFTPQNTITDSPETRGDELLAALDTLVSENTRSGSPLNGKLATDRFGVMGHSMGGGGTLFACNKGSSRIKAAVPLMPWQPGGKFPDCTAPTLLVAAEKDALVNPASMAYPEYQSLGATNKAYMEVAGADHVAANDVSGGNNLYARYAIAWLKVYLENDSRYQKFISGDAHKSDVAAKLFVTFEP